MVDREDGTGAGFNGVLDAAEEKNIANCPPGQTTVMKCPSDWSGNADDCVITDCRPMTTTTMAPTTQDGVSCVVDCTNKGGDLKTCEIVCSVGNKNQCENGRNKCSENAVCKDLEDELTDGAIVRKLFAYFV